MIARGEGIGKAGQVETILRGLCVPERWDKQDAWARRVKKMRRFSMECGGNDAALASSAQQASQSGFPATLCHRAGKNPRHVVSGAPGLVAWNRRWHGI